MLDRVNLSSCFGVCHGKDNRAIAAQLSIYISTVRKHLENIYRKL
ncbi:MAG: LuxR C-terminal-related transcriptional regulator [Xenococcaceae cyanobacterium]